MVDGVDFKGFWNVRWRAIAKPRGIPFDLPKTAPVRVRGVKRLDGCTSRSRNRLAEEIVQDKKLEGRMR